MLEILSYNFIIRALIVGVIVSLCSSLLGVSLVLKKYSMIGDGLSHVSFGALAIATALNIAPLKFAIPIVIIVAFFLLKISDNAKIKGDSAIALISAGSLAIGIISVSVSTGVNTDVYSYLFGSILAISKSDMILSVILGLLVLVIYILFYNKLFAITFDENFAKATGVKVNAYNMIIAFLTAITIVLGMKLMGSLLITSLIIFPSLTSMKLLKTFKSVVISSGILSIINLIIGIIISYYFDVPTGASIVIINILMFILFSLISFLLQFTQKN